MNYKYIAKSYNKLHSEEQLEKLKIISKYLKVKSTDKLLDIGCGTGISTNYFKCNSIGIDPCKELIEQGEKNLILGEAEKLPFKGKEFDIILCITAIHNFNNYKKAIKEMKRVLKEKGKIAVTILKKSKNFKEIKQELNKNFKLKEDDHRLDLILIGINK